MRKNKEEDEKEKEKLKPQHAEKRGGRQEGAPGTVACGKRADTKGVGIDETEDQRIQQPQSTKQRRSNNTEPQEQEQPQEQKPTPEQPKENQ